MSLTLISHHLCPYVQRAAIVLLEKGIPFERREVDLANKPDWFRAISPLGKTPVLLVGDAPVFESAVICDYLDETHLPAMHPQEPLARARHRGWVEMSSALLNAIGGFYSAADAAALHARRADISARFQQVDQALDAAGPYFAGSQFCIVDAAFAPVFRYFDAFKRFGESGFLDAAPRVRAWRDALAARPSVQQAVPDDFAERLHAFLLARGSELSRRAGQ